MRTAPDGESGTGGHGQGIGAKEKQQNGRYFNGHLRRRSLGTPDFSFGLRPNAPARQSPEQSTTASTLIPRAITKVFAALGDAAGINVINARRHLSGTQFLAAGHWANGERRSRLL
jgi:hypothetical protein